MSRQGLYDFYRDRIASCPSYGFKAGEELLNLIIRCVNVDPLLTVTEVNSIIISAYETHKKLMEVNYNAGWTDE